MSDQHTHSHHHHHGGIDDYMKAVAEYRKTFPNKQDVIEQTPDPAVREMLLHMEEMGLETTFDRFDAQQPQCTFGIAGTCCKNCFMGPCKITGKVPSWRVWRGRRFNCGQKSFASCGEQTQQTHGARGRESMLALKFAAQGKAPIPIEGKEKIYAVCKNFGIRDKKEKHSMSLQNKLQIFFVGRFISNSSG